MNCDLFNINVYFPRVLIDLEYKLRAGGVDTYDGVYAWIHVVKKYPEWKVLNGLQIRA